MFKNLDPVYGRYTKWCGRCRQQRPYTRSVSQERIEGVRVPQGSVTGFAGAYCVPCSRQYHKSKPFGPGHLGKALNNYVSAQQVLGSVSPTDLESFTKALADLYFYGNVELQAKLRAMAEAAKPYHEFLDLINTEFMGASK